MEIAITAVQELKDLLDKAGFDAPAQTAIAAKGYTSTQLLA